MTKKAEFNAEEWSKVVQGPLLAGLRVGAAERGGVIRESIAMAEAYADARRRQGDSELLDELVASPPALDPGLVSQGGGDIAAVVRERLAESVALVDAKATAEEAEAYRRFVLGIAETVAGASREGGFLGIGGKPVSDAERAAIDELASLLGSAPPRPS